MARRQSARDRTPVVQVDGLKELRKSLRQAGEDMTDLKQANREAAGTVESATQPPRRSGTLAGTLRSTGTVTAGIIRAGKKSVPYAGPIHWGWPARNIEPQPFLVDAAQATEPQWAAAYEAHIDRILNNIKGK